MKGLDVKSALIGAAVAVVFLNYAYRLGIGGTMVQWAGPRNQGGFF